MMRPRADSAVPASASPTIEGEIERMSASRRWSVLVAAAFLIPFLAQAKPGDAIGSHTAKVNGVEIHYLAAGAGDKTPVILLHGYAETGHMWLPLIPKID